MKQPKDKNIGKTIVGFIKQDDLNAIYASNIPVYRTDKLAAFNTLSSVYEVTLKIVRKA